MTAAILAFPDPGAAPADTLAAALAWAARGFRVFPLSPGSKKPLAGFDDWPTRASTDPAAIRAMWGTASFNVGVLTSGLVVVDVDTKGGKRGPQSFLEPALGLHRDTLIVTTPSGGEHVYYRGPDLGNRADLLGPGSGLDIRAFHGYVVAPGSWLDPADPDNKGVGGLYTVARDAGVAYVPPGLLARLDAPRERSTAAPVIDLDAAESVAAAEAYLQGDAPAAVEGAGGDDATYRVAAKLHGYGLTEATALGLMLDWYNPRCSPAWSYEELETKVANGFAYATNAPGSESPLAMVQGVEIDPPVSRAARTPAGDWYACGDPVPADEWAYFELLPCVGVALLVAPSQAGKSFVAVHVAHSLATGAPFFGVEPEARGGSVFLAAEGDLRKRFAALNAGRQPIAACSVRGLSAAHALDAVEAAVIAKSAEMVAEFGVPVRLVVLDTLSASGLLEDENDNAEAADALTRLAVMSRRLGVLFLAVHHPTKDGRGERGAGAIKNSADYVLTITREGDASIREVELTKARDAAQRALGCFTLEPVTVGHDAKGRAVVSCIVTTSSQSVRKAEKARREYPYMRPLVETVEWALQDHGEMIEGRPLVDYADVRVTFRRDRFGVGKRNFDRTWDRALAEAKSAGLVEEVVWMGRKYLTALSAVVA